ncbi:MAG: hypothetical protein KDB23_12880 [Planctomycetales bacterium]|nr:hypothetical protein [Planctomycetales bacterium]
MNCTATQVNQFKCGRLKTLAIFSAGIVMGAGVMIALQPYEWMIRPGQQTGDIRPAEVVAAYEQQMAATRRTLAEERQQLQQNASLLDELQRHAGPRLTAERLQREIKAGEQRVATLVASLAKMEGEFVDLRLALQQARTQQGVTTEERAKQKQILMEQEIGLDPLEEPQR